MKKRTKIELHCHTKMSAGKGLIEPSELVRYAYDNGYKAIAITDCGSVQAFLEVYRTWKALWKQYEDECKRAEEEARQEDFLKIIYGMEGVLTDELLCLNENVHSLSDECTVIDIETTGFSVRNDAILRVDAVKVKNGKLGERISSYVLQEREISENVTKITGITKDDLKDAKPECQVIADLISFIGNSFLVMFNAGFDLQFLKKACEKYDICFDPNYVDVYKICKYLAPAEKVRKSLLLEKYRIEDDGMDNDCTFYAKLYNKVCECLKNRDINSFEEVNLVIDKKLVKGKQKGYPVLLYAKNETGIRNLYKIVTESLLSAHNDGPTITRNILDKYRDGLLVGAVCDGGEVMTAIHTEMGSRSDAEYRRDLSNILSYYDFIEVSPFGADKGNDVRYMYHVVNNGGMLVAASDAYYLYEEDKLYWDILTNGRIDEYTDRPRHLVKWDEVNKPFGCWVSGDPKTLKEIPAMEVANQSTIADQIEYISPLREGKFLPKYPDAEEQLRLMCEEKVRELFNGEMPKEVSERLNTELNAICKNGFARLYMMWSTLAAESKEKEYPVVSRGAVASSLVAFLCGITDINPLSEAYGGYNIPSEIFMGLNLDKEPDIDLNFASGIRELIQDRVAKLPGVGATCHAGTISRMLDKTAKMHVQEYYINNNLPMPDEESIMLQARKISGVKRCDGHHPGGILVVPEGKDITSFTPLQHPWCGNRISSHFEYHDLADNLLRMDILEYRPCELMHIMQEKTGVAVASIPLNDDKVLAMLCDFDIEEIDGLPEFGSKAARAIIRECKAKTYDDLIKVDGLIHGTDVWENNQRKLILNHEMSIEDCVASRDDIFLMLLDKGMDRSLAYRIMESVRKGNGLKKDMILEMRKRGVSELYINIFKKIRYLFPKAHTVSYTLAAWRLAYYMTYYPKEYSEALKQEKHL